MKKKGLLFVAMLFSALVTTAQSFTLGWYHTLDSQPAAADSPSAVEVAKDGNYLVFHTWGSTGGQNGAAKDENAQFKIDGKTVNGADGKPIEGAGYWSGNSYNANVALEKIDKTTGEVLWTVYSDRGDNLHSYCHVQPASDGGAYLMLYSRHWDEDAETTLLRLRSTKSTEAVTLNTELGLFTGSDGNQHKFYVPVLAKVSADGVVEWAKVIIEPTAVDKGSKFPAWISFTNSFAVDADDNIYVGGNYRTTITFTDKDGNKTATTPKNVSGWNGDDQNTIGDLYLAKFDKEGNFLRLFTVESDAAYANAAFVDQLAIGNGKVLFEGRLLGNGSTVTIAGTAMTAATAGQSMIYGAFDADLNPVYAKLLNQTGTSGALQCENAQFLNGSFYLTGSSMKQTYSDSEGHVVLAPNATGSTQHQGFIIKIDPEMGNVLAAGNQGNSRSISKYFGVFETRNAEGETGLYAFGYEMTGGSVIVSFSEEDGKLTKTGYKDIVKYGITATASGTIAACGTPAITNGELVVIHRMGANNQDKKVYFDDGTVSENYVHSWANVLIQIKNPDIYVIPEPEKIVLDFTDGSLRKTGTALADTEGFIYNETLSSGDIALQVTAGSAPSRLTNAGNRGNCLVTYSEYSSLKFTAPEGKAIQKIVFTLAGSGKLNFTAENGTLTENTWEGNADAVRFRATGTSYIAKAEVVYTDKDDATEALPALQYQEVNSIEAFNALENGTYAKLNLKDAEVTGISADGYSTVFLQDATSGAWIQYTSLNTSLQPGTKINGYIYCTKRMSSANPLVKETEDTPSSQIEATPIDDFTVAEYATIGESESSLFQLIKLQGASFEATSTTAGTLTLGDETITVNNGAATANQQLHLIDGFTKGDKKENVTIVGILVRTSATKMQILPLELYTAETITLAEGWSTFVANDGCDFVVPEDATAYIITDTDAENGTVTATPVSDGIIPDGAAVLISSEKDEITLTENQGETSATTDLTANLLKAGDGTTSFSLSDNVYALSEGLFMRYEGIVPEGKAYLQLTASSQAKLSIVIDGQTTGISQTEAQKTAAGKQLFDLSGRRVERPAKGIYILNGRKVIVK